MTRPTLPLVGIRAAASSKWMSAALRGSDVPKPDDFGTAGRPAHSARFWAPFLLSRCWNPAMNERSLEPVLIRFGDPRACEKRSHSPIAGGTHHKGRRP